MPFIGGVAGWFGGVFMAGWRGGVAFLIVIYFGVFPATAGCASPCSAPHRALFLVVVHCSSTCSVPGRRALLLIVLCSCSSCSGPRRAVGNKEKSVENVVRPVLLIATQFPY